LHPLVHADRRVLLVALVIAEGMGPDRRARTDGRLNGAKGGQVAPSRQVGSVIRVDAPKRGELLYPTLRIIGPLAADSLPVNPTAEAVVDHLRTLGTHLAGEIAHPECRERSGAGSAAPRRRTEGDRTETLRALVRLRHETDILDAEATDEEQPWLAVVRGRP
jgi:hypothetical protein